MDLFSVINQIGLGILTAFVCFIAAEGWRRALKTIHMRHARGFWQNFAQGNARIIVPRFYGHIKFKHEQIGLIPCGTSNAITELQVELRTLKIPEPSVSYADRILDGDDLKAHLILFGGPSSHKLMKETLARLKTGWQFQKKPDGVNVICDIKSGHMYESKIRQDLYENGLEEVGLDYALLFKTTNPFSKKHTLLHVAGLHDYGTWAAVRFLLTKEFKHHPLVAQEKCVEALIEVDVLQGSPQGIKLIAIRELT
jgi:hypothetical protein